MSEKIHSHKSGDPVYHALTNISLDGEEYPIGAAVPLTEKQAAQIKDAVSTVIPAKEGTQSNTNPAKPDTSTQAQVVAAIGKLNADDKAHWTKSGKPQIDALEALLDAPVTATQRDAAWEVFEADAG